MALWICKECTAAYAVGLPACPQCGTTTHTTQDELERTVPKINRTGPSYAPTPADAEPAETEATDQTAADGEPETAPPTKATKATPDAAPADPPASPPPAPSK